MVFLIIKETIDEVLVPNSFMNCVLINKTYQFAVSVYDNENLFPEQADYLKVW